MGKTTKRISVIGLGRIGLPTAALLAARGARVDGVDIDPDRVAAVDAGVCPFHEPELEAIVRAAHTSGRLRASTAPAAADVFVIAVPTLDASRAVSGFGALPAVAASLGPVLKAGDLIIVESTVPVGTMARLCECLGEARRDLSFPGSGEEPGGVRVAYCPERVLPGRILQELETNDRVIGGMTHSCAVAASAVYRTFVRGELCLTTAAVAEVVKLAENAFRDVNIAFANELSLVCKTLGIHPAEVIALANRHPRVRMLSPGPGVGGYCIPPSSRFLSKAVSDPTPLMRAARRVNDGMPAEVVRDVVEACAGIENPQIACLGLAYKAGSGEARRSPAVEVVRKLQEAGIGSLLVVDPHVAALPEDLCGHNGTRHVGLDSALETADVIVLLTDHREFMSVDPGRIAGRPFVDSRGCWPPLASGNLFRTNR